MSRRKVLIYVSEDRVIIKKAFNQVLNTLLPEDDMKDLVVSSDLESEVKSGDYGLVVDATGDGSRIIDSLGLDDSLRPEIEDLDYSKGSLVEVIRLTYNFWKKRVSEVMMVGFELSLSHQLKLDQRQKLEARLEQKIETKQELKLELGQYLILEDIFKGFITWADENDGWRTYDNDGFKFTYAALPYELAKPIADHTGSGFAHCWYNAFEAMLFGQKRALARGDWTLFVVPDMIPKGFEEFVALHERGEEISLGNHFFSSQLEFASVAKHNKIRSYTKDIDDNYPNKFVDLTQEVLFPILPEDLREELESKARNNEDLDRAKELIDSHPIPTSVLRLMDRYESVCEDNYEVFKEAGSQAQNVIAKVRLAPMAGGVLVGGRMAPEDLIQLVEPIIASPFKRLSDRDIKVIPHYRASEALEHINRLKKDFVEVSGRSLIIPQSLREGYDAINNGDPVAFPAYTAADIKRMEEDNIS